MVETREPQIKSHTDSFPRIWSALVERCPEAVLVLQGEGEESGRVLLANAAACRLHGCAEAELVGRRISSLVMEEAPREEWEAGTATLVRADGSRVAVQCMSGRVFLDGRWVELRYEHAVSLEPDTQLELRDIGLNLQELLDRVGQGIGLVDPQEVFVLVNRMGEEIFGVAPGTLVGRNLKEFVPPAEWQRVLEETAQRKHGEASIYALEIQRPDGERRIIQVTATPRLDANHVFLGTFGVFQDVTDQKRAQEEQRRIELQMLHAQKLESLGVLAGGIAHDFNNLLVAILGNADMALAELPAQSPTRSTLEEITGAARHAADLCRQLLAYSGHGCRVVEFLDPSALMREMGHLLEVSISKNVHLNYQLSDQVPAVRADASQVRQVIMNLIINASEAMAQAGGQITLRTGAVEADGAMLARAQVGQHLPPGCYALLEVVDTGTGMDAATLARIFDPFFSTKFAGRGLGLAAVLGIVRGHHGAILVESTPGQGTSFRVLLPTNGWHAPASNPTATRTVPWKGTGMVLVVDDEPLVRQTARRMVAHLGFTPVLASSGTEALALFEQYRAQVACVILDLTMPPPDGAATLAQLRRIQPDVRVVVASGYTEQEVAERFGPTGSLAFVQKPYSLAGLEEKLRAVLEEAPHPGYP